MRAEKIAEFLHRPDLTVDQRVMLKKQLDEKLHQRELRKRRNPYRWFFKVDEEIGAAQTLKELSAIRDKIEAHPRYSRETRRTFMIIISDRHQILMEAVQ